MNPKTLALYMLELANQLDQKGLHVHADRYDGVAIRLAQATGPFNMNIPMSGRVQPYDRYHEKELDGVEQDRQKHPRLRPTDYIDDGLSPEDLGKQDDLTPKQQQQVKQKQKQNPDEDTIFGMDDKDPAKGGDPFRMHDQGTAGWGFVTYDPQAAGMVGLDRFTWENKRDVNDNASDRYKLLLPQT